MSLNLRPAIAMVELIFALFIIGLILMSAPQLISTSANSGYVAIQQEAINEAATQVNLLLGYSWDEAVANTQFAPVILRVTHGNNDLDESTKKGLRKGTPIISRRTFIRSDGRSDLNATATTLLGSDNQDRDDIDDFIGNIGLTLIANSSIDYIEKDTININTAVSYITDTPLNGDYTPNGSNTITFAPDFSSNPAGTTNIKRITVRLTSESNITELDKDITLNAFSCNIGSTHFEERTF